MVGPAGIFNTGTNLLFELMKHNCDIREAAHSTTHREPRRNGVRWQAPWGKHNPVSTHRLRNVAKMWGPGINQTVFFPVVMIKDPYGWMGSLCRHRYGTFWDHDARHCPNVVDWRIPGVGAPVKVLVKFAMGIVRYASLVDMWNRWYLDYEAQGFPLLRTRFEDLLFHGEEVTRRVCACVGGVFADEFKYIEGSATENGMPIHVGANGLVKALLQYGDPGKRTGGMTDADRRFAAGGLDEGLMRRFGYGHPPPP